MWRYKEGLSTCMVLCSISDVYCLSDVPMRSRVADIIRSTRSSTEQYNSEFKLCSGMDILLCLRLSTLGHSVNRDPPRVDCTLQGVK